MLTQPIMTQTPPPTPSTIKLDGANGVGAEKVRRLVQCIRETAGDMMTIDVYNDGTSGILNENVCECV